MSDEEFTKLVSAGRDAYFRAADVVLAKIRLRYGSGPEGFWNFLNSNNGVDNFSSLEEKLSTPLVLLKNKSAEEVEKDFS